MTAATKAITTTIAPSIVGDIQNIHKLDFQLHFPFPTGYALAIQILCSPLNSLTAHSGQEDGAQDIMGRPTSGNSIRYLKLHKRQR